MELPDVHSSHTNSLALLTFPSPKRLANKGAVFKWVTAHQALPFPPLVSKSYHLLIIPWKGFNYILLAAPPVIDVDKYL